jgi:5-methylcytosine-specific restriction endonuclease McrA
MGIRLVKQGVINDNALDEFFKAYSKIENLHIEHEKELIKHKEELEAREKERKQKLNEIKNLLKELNLKSKQYKDKYRQIYLSLLRSKDDSNTELAQIEKEQESNTFQIKVLRNRLNQLNILDVNANDDLWQSNADRRIEEILSLGQIILMDKTKICSLSFKNPNTLAEFLEKQELEPRFIVLNSSLDDDEYFLFRKNLYCINSCDSYTLVEQQLLIKEYYFKHKNKFKRLQKEIRLYEKLELKNELSREPIPEEVRFIVWRRDDGKCVKCGNKEKLEFDHIIPVSKGGSNTERNVQLLCEKCNREKSAKI